MSWVETQGQTLRHCRTHIELEASSFVCIFETSSLLDPIIMANKTRRRRASIEIVDAKQAVDLATAQTYSENVFLFVPNLIGKLSSEWPSPMLIRLIRLYSCDHGRAVIALHELSPNLLYVIV